MYLATPLLEIPYDYAHIDLIGSTSRIHSPNVRTERYLPTRHTFVSRLESEWSEPPRKRSLASVATPEKV